MRTLHHAVAFWFTLTCVLSQTYDDEQTFLRYLFLLTGGPGWTNNSGWLDAGPSDHCGWYGVTCADVADTMRVTSLQLDSNNLRGTLPAGFNNLPHVSTIVFYNNRLSGSFPRDILELPNIATLILSNNFIGGELPNVALPSNLMVLDVSSNMIGGAIPESLFENCQALAYLLMSDNQLQGTLPSSLGTCSGLIYLDLESNSIYGPIPDEWQSLINLQQIYLGDNNINGTLQPFTSMKNLQALSVFRNLLQSPLPMDLSNMSSLRTLVVNANAFDESLPTWLGTMSNLVYLDMSANSFRGDIDDLLSNNRWSAMTYLGLSLNQISGSIPTSIGGMKGLMTLDVSDNALSGPLPASMRYLSKLSRLYINGNNFQVTMDQLFSSLPVSLQIVAVDNNNISGTIPPQFTSFSRLVSFTAANNLISGTIPQKIVAIDFTYLDLSNNHLQGQVPDNLDIIPLQTLKLEGNSLKHAADGPLLPAFAIIAEDANYIKNFTGGYSCPVLSGAKRKMDVSIDASYYDHFYCTCDVGFLGKNGTCVLCIEHAKCEGDIIAIDPGFFPVPSIHNISDTLACPKLTAQQTACNPGGGPDFVCLTGHEGRLCSLCVPGYFRQGRVCKKCDAGNLWLVLTLVALIIVAVGIVIAWDSKLITKGTDGTGTVQIALAYLQYMALLGMTSISWTDFMRWLLEIHSVSGNIAPYGIDCIVKDPIYSYMAKFIVPVMLWFLVVIICFVRRKTFLDVLSVTTFYFNTCTFYFTAQAVAAWNCTSGAPSEGGKTFVDSFPWLECRTPEHHRMVAISVVGFVAYWIVPTAVLITLNVARYKRRSVPGTLSDDTVFGWIFAPFAQKYWWWFLVQHARKSSVAFAVALTKFDSNSLLFVMSFIIATALIAQSVALPFGNKFNNWLELGSMGILMITYFGGMALGGSWKLYVGISITIFAMNVIFFVAIVVFLVVIFHVPAAASKFKMRLQRAFSARFIASDVALDTVNKDIDSASSNTTIVPRENKDLYTFDNFE